MTKEEIIEKVKKCLALSQSANEHEAAIALRQAQRLMAAHGISDLDILAAGASEARAKSGATSKPASWEARLSGIVADVFGCRVIFMGGAGEWNYIGCGVAPELAKYAFDVMFRQARRARTDYIANRLKRCKTTTKTRRADLFSAGWVDVAAGKISAYAGSDQQNDAIAAYVDQHYPALVDGSTINRNKGKALRGHEVGDLLAGCISGRGADLNRGVGSAGGTLALEG